MMFDFMGWHEAARLIEGSMEHTILQKKVTYDFERMLEGATKVKTSEFASSHDSQHGAHCGVGSGVARWHRARSHQIWRHMI